MPQHEIIYGLNKKQRHKTAPKTARSHSLFIKRSGFRYFVILGVLYLGNLLFWDFGISVCWYFGMLVFWYLRITLSLQVLYHSERFITPSTFSLQAAGTSLSHSDYFLTLGTLSLRTHRAARADKVLRALYHSEHFITPSTSSLRALLQGRTVAIACLMSADEC